MPVASQSVTLEALSASVQRILELSTELDASLIRNWWSDDRPRFEGQSALITWKLMIQAPRKFDGANRLGFLANQSLQIDVYRRYSIDSAGGVFHLATNSYYPLLLKVINGFQGLMIFSEYDDDWTPSLASNFGIPDTALLFTRIPVQMSESSQPRQPKPDPGWCGGSVDFDLCLVQPLTTTQVQ